MTDQTSLPAAASNRARNLYTLLIFAALVLVMIVVTVSAYLRLAGSGLGCTEWPACYALIQSRDGTTTLAAAHLVPPWATVTHRLAASTLGLLVLGIVASALRRRREPEQSLAIPFALLALTVFLSLLGYRTPSPLMPWVALSNLLGGMAMLAMLWWLGSRSVSAGVASDAARRLRPWAFAGMVVVFLQIALGGWVSANFAALACTNFPGCGNFPWLDGPWRESFNLARTLPVTDGGAVIVGDTGKIIHLAHRVGALVTFLYIGWLGWRALVPGAPTRSTGVAMLTLLALQILVGIWAVASGLPLIVVALHNGVAALLLLSVVNLFHLLTPKT
ncbi:MAG TPA: COX15/CtaA family protein [Candidatus Methylomirabilis sp.]|nr:COX15/CtaA family protein [Candidatus Methylomirabilis sp.]